MQAKHPSSGGAGRLALFVIFMATLAVLREAASVESEQSKRDAGTTMEKPTYRTTSFVPRLGKREPNKPTALDRLKVDRLLCANYGLDCGRLLEELSRLTGPVLIEPASAESIRAKSLDNSNSPLAALIDSLSQSISTQEGNLRLASEQDYETNVLDLLARRLANSIAREPRGSSDELFDSLPISFVGSRANKRVAFTPRIG